MITAVCLLDIGWSGVRAAEPPTPTYRLDQVITLALERNPALLGAEGVLEQSRGQQVAAGAYPDPTVTSQSGRGALREPSGQTITEYAVSVGQPLEWLGKRAARQRVAEAGFAGASAGLEETRLNLIAEVKIAFYELLAAQRQELLARQNLRTVEQVAQIVKTRVRSGEGPQFEVIKAEVEVLKANQAVTRAENAVRIAQVGVDTLTAGALELPFTIEGDFESFQKDLNLEALTRLARRGHPTIRRLAKQVERADHNVVFERESRIPNVTVKGGYWREVGREAVTAGLNLQMPVWYQRQGEIASALGGKRRDEAELLRTRNEIVKGVNQHFQDARTAAKQIEVFDKGLLRQAQEALRIAQFSFQQGVSSLLEVLDAQRVFRQTQLEYMQARWELSVALARLERSVGVPFEGVNVPTP
ncbi:MAG: TolC family protein [Nitrospiraceae bacterium]